MYLKSLKSIIIKVLLFVFSFLIFIPASSQEKKYQGLLWEISGNELKKPSYIYGTMHVSKKLAFHLSDTFFIAIKNCDMVALEINPDTWFEELVKSDLIAGFVQEQNSYSYGRDFYGEAFSLKAPENKTIGELLSANHMLTNYMLYRFGSESDNFEENTYLDLFIYQTGKKQNKKVSSLEDAETMLEMTGKASLPDEEDDESYYSNSDWYEKVRASGKSPQELIEDAYRLGDLDMLDSLSNMMNNSKNYIKYMIVERNKQMAYRLDSLMKLNSVFAGAGAAHLPGNFGIINLLREKGYNVRPVGKITSKKTDQLMKKSETTFYPLTYKKQFVGDSLFSCNFPGDILETPGFEKNKEYFYPEMINGAHYNITRINTYGPITGFSQDYMMKRIDSLFYENIPGKIIKKKTINLQGIPGYDIINKTRRGDFQRYNIFVTPLEIIIVKIGGTGEFAKKDGDKFFASFNFNHKATNGWKTLNSRKGGFTIEMPVDMLVSSDHLDISSTNEIFQSMDFSDSSYFVVMKGSLHDFYYIEEDSFELNYITKQFFKELKYNKLKDSLISFQNFPALDATATYDSIRFMHTRLIIKGADYYLLANQNFSEIPNSRFFNSFKLKDYKYEEKFIEYVDTNMFFRVNTIEPPKKSNLFGYSNNYYGRGKKNKEDWSFLPENKYESYYCPQTRENVVVEYFRFHKYAYYHNFDSIINEFIETNKKNSSLNSKIISRGFIDSLPYFEILQTDTNSTRAIKSRIILKHGASWTITACIDTISKENKYFKEFFESFRPTDTIIGNNVFQEKVSIFFNDLNSEDSLIKTHALRSIYAIDFEKKDKNKLLEIINSSEFNSFSLKERSSFIFKLSEISEENDLDIFNKFYLTFEDTATLQLSILQALTNQKTISASKTFKELLISNPPFTDSEYDMMPMFEVFYDSLELAKPLFPDILKLTRYKEYSSLIYDLLAKMVDSSIIMKKDLEGNYSELLLESSIELKRKIASKENSTEKNYLYNREMVSNGINIPNPGNNYYDQFNLLNFVSILSVFKDERQVKEFYNKIFATGDDDVKIKLTEKYLENNWTLNDTVVSYFAKTDKYRWEIFKALKDNNKTHLVPDSLFNQENIARSLLLSESYSKKRDSIVFITKKIVKTKNHSGYVYFYKTKGKDEKKWNLNYVGIQPADTTTFSLDINIYNNYNRLNELIDIDKQINDLMEKIAMKDRKRVSLKKYHGGYY